MERDKQQPTLDDRIRFVARHYREGRFDEEAAWRRFASSHGIRRANRFVWRWASAAAVALLFVCSIYYIMYRERQPEWIVVATDARGVKEVYLPDSSCISLAAASEVRYDRKAFGVERRDIRLRGKAFFRVKHDEALPFTVRTEATEVTVLGTTFQVAERRGRTSVDVLTGRVRLEAAGEKVVLTEGMSATYEHERRRIELAQRQSANVLSWETKVLRFENTPLAEVVHDLEECYGIRILNYKETGQKLTATFRELPVEDVLRIINETLNTEWSYE